MRVVLGLLPYNTKVYLRKIVRNQESEIMERTPSSWSWSYSSGKCFFASASNTPAANSQTAHIQWNFRNFSRSNAVEIMLEKPKRQWMAIGNTDSNEPGLAEIKEWELVKCSLEGTSLQYHVILKIRIMWCWCMRCCVPCNQTSTSIFLLQNWIPSARIEDEARLSILGFLAQSPWDCAKESVMSTFSAADKKWGRAWLGEPDMKTSLQTTLMHSAHFSLSYFAVSLQKNPRALSSWRRKTTHGKLYHENSVKWVSFKGRFSFSIPPKKLERGFIAGKHVCTLHNLVLTC